MTTTLPAAAGDMRLSGVERRTRQTALGPGGQRFGVQTSIGHARICRHAQGLPRLSQQSLDRLVALFGSMRHASSLMRTIRRLFLARRSACIGIEHLADVERASVFGDALEAA